MPIHIPETPPSPPANVATVPLNSTFGEGGLGLTDPKGPIPPREEPVTPIVPDPPVTETQVNDGVDPGLSSWIQSKLKTSVWYRLVESTQLPIESTQSTQVEGGKHFELQLPQGAMPESIVNFSWTMQGLTADTEPEKVHASAIVVDNEDPDNKIIVIGKHTLDADPNSPPQEVRFTVPWRARLVQIGGRYILAAAPDEQTPFRPEGDERAFVKLMDAQTGTLLYDLHLGRDGVLPDQLLSQEVTDYLRNKGAARDHAGDWRTADFVMPGKGDRRAVEPMSPYLNKPGKGPTAVVFVDGGERVNSQTPPDIPLFMQIDSYTGSWTVRPLDEVLRESLPEGMALSESAVITDVRPVTDEEGRNPLAGNSDVYVVIVEEDREQEGVKKVEYLLYSDAAGITKDQKGNETTGMKAEKLTPQGSGHPIVGTETNVVVDDRGNVTVLYGVVRSTDIGPMTAVDHLKFKLDPTGGLVRKKYKDTVTSSMHMNSNGGTQATNRRHTSPQPGGKGFYNRRGDTRPGKRNNQPKPQGYTTKGQVRGRGRRGGR